MSSRPSQFVYTQPGPYRLYSTVELLKLPAPTYLVDKVVPEGGLVGLYGPPGHGKSFVAVDLTMCVGTGRPWFGHPVQQGLAVYISAEGGAGIGKRVATWLTEHKVPGSQANVAWMTEAITIGSETDSMARLFERLQKEVREHPALFVIDTLARCFEGNENQQEDMGRFIQGADRMRREFNSTVVVVHHTGVDGSRERGSTAFRGAVDTMMLVKKPEEGKVIVSCDKQKDDEPFADLTLRLKKNDQLNSCVVVNDAVEGTDTILVLLAQAGPVGLSFTALEAQALAAGTSRSTLKRRLKAMLTNGDVKRQDGVYFL